MTQSLRSRTERAFLRPLMLAVTGVTVLAGVMTFLTISAQRDEHMRQSARLVQLLATHEALERDVLGSTAQSLDTLPRKLLGVRAEYRIWSERGQLARSAEMPEFDRQRDDGFHAVAFGGVRWRVFVLNAADPPISVELAEPEWLRLTAMVEVMLGFAIPLSALIIAVVAIARRGIGEALGPLLALSTEIDHRDSDDLTLIESGELPTELIPLLSALNRLLERVHAALERERAFSDNAAHELRTPLAALKLRAQVAARKMASDPGLAADLAHLNAAVDRTALVIDRLLALSRIASPNRAEIEFDLSAVVAEAGGELAGAAAAKGITLTSEIEPALHLRGDPVAVGLAVRNLLENAVKFTQQRGIVQLHLRSVGPRLEVRVSDNGPGVPEGNEAKIFDRFHRERSDVPGSGLGLALVREVADLYGGSVAARRLDPQGLQVVLSFPSVTSTSSIPQGCAPRMESPA